MGKRYGSYRFTYGFKVSDVDFVNDPWSGNLVQIEGCDRIMYVVSCREVVNTIKCKNIPPEVKKDVETRGGRIRTLGFVVSFMI